MTAQLSPAPVFRSWDNNGLPLYLGKLYTYAAGTTTPQATYTDSTQTTQNPNPVILNFRGEAFVWLNPLLSYKYVLYDALGNLIWTEDNIQGAIGVASNIVPSITNTFTLGTPTITFANAYFGPNGAAVFDPVSGNIGYYARTAAEIAAGVTPVNYAYTVGPYIDVRRYGFAEAASAATNTTALNSAMAVAAAQTNGGWVQLPAGSFNLNQPNNIPAFVIVNGAGKRATQILFAGSTTLFTLGGTSNTTLYYGCGMSNMDIRLSNATTTTEAVRCQGTQGARVEELYIQGTTGTAGNFVGVTIDGCNISSFQNYIRGVQCNHVGNGFRMLTSGSQVCTQTEFNNCYAANGDVGTSVGFSVQNGCGNGSTWIGGDIEQQGTGVSIGAGASGGVTFHGTRFEGNTVDVLIGATPFQCGFFGCVNLNAITDNSAGGGYQQHQYVGCISGQGSGPWTNLPNQFVGSLNARSAVVTDVPLQAQAVQLQSGDLFNVWNFNKSIKLFSVDSGGVITSLAGSALKITVGSGSPNGVVTAPPGSLYLNVGGGAGNTLWVKETLTTSSGWVAK